MSGGSISHMSIMAQSHRKWPTQHCRLQAKSSVTAHDKAEAHGSMQANRVDFQRLPDDSQAWVRRHANLRHDATEDEIVRITIFSDPVKPRPTEKSIQASIERPIGVCVVGVGR